MTPAACSSRARARETPTARSPCRGTCSTSRGAFDRLARDRLVPAYRPAARPPAAALHAYGAVVTTPRPLLAVALLLALAAVIRRTRYRREVFLLAGSGTALALGSVATSELIVRYLVPAVPLLLLAGVIAAVDLAAGRR